jgi:aerobic carbon-monoxide dehydrogenase large subunit
VHAAIVDVDLETGEVRIDRYVIVHDAGVLVNPTLAEGQVVGGAAQGIGAALWEDPRSDCPRWCGSRGVAPWP